MSRRAARGLRHGLMALALAGCAAGQPIDRQVVVSGARFDNVRGEMATDVRTYITGEDGQSRELSGAACEVASSLYSTSLVTPARLVVPSFGPQSPELDVICAAGDASGSATVRPNTTWRYPPGYYSAPAVGVYGGTGGVAGVSLGWGGWGGWGYGAPAYPVSQYPDVRVELR